MYCKKCGKELIEENSNFCPKCGTKITNINRDIGNNENTSKDKEQNKQQIKSLFKNPTFVAGIIIYVILVVSFWGLLGAWSLLAAPVIWILALANDGFRNIEGRRIYGDKWDKMTNYEQETQMKKDQIIHDISKNKK